MRILTLFSALLILGLTPPATAQEDQPIFRDYADMRGQLDTLMMTRRIHDVMIAFGGADEMTSEELTQLEYRVRSVFPQDFENVDILKADDMGNGWKRELYVYWTGISYIFASVLMHRQEAGLVSINFEFNSDFGQLIDDF